MPSVRDLLAAFLGVRALIGLDAQGFRFFDNGAAGFWKSFWAAAFLLPPWMLMIADAMKNSPPADEMHFIAIQAIGYVVGWLAYPLIVEKLCRVLERRNRFFTYMTAYNWFQVGQALLLTPFLLLARAGAMPPQLEFLIWLALQLGYGWFLARRGLSIEGIHALALVVIDVLLGLLIEGVTDSLA